jgi:hypothetical protein
VLRSLIEPEMANVASAYCWLMISIVAVTFGNVPCFDV